MGSADGGEATARRLLEREGEIVALEDALGRAAAGSGSMVAFEGAAGLGKSTLLAEGARLARERGMTVLAASGEELEQGLPWEPVTVVSCPTNSRRPTCSPCVERQARRTLRG